VTRRRRGKGVHLGSEDEAEAEEEDGEEEEKKEKKSKESAAEIYGFVGYLISFVVYGLFLAWAYLPESVLCQMGLSYYPSKSVALVPPPSLP
jgi:PIG-P